MADARAIATAVSVYSNHTGRLPGSLEDLTQTVMNARGENAGPFLLKVPETFASQPYRYETNADGTFRISGESHGQVIEAGTAVTTAR